MIRVLVVDDSIVFRRILENALGRHPGIRVVGTAVNGKDALHKIRRLRPHLLVLDVEMPEMNGLQTLDEIKRQRLDVGVIMFSSLTVEGASTTIEALSKGAFDFVPKPSGQGAFAESVKNIQGELVPKIEAYASSIQARRPIRRPARPPSRHPKVPPPPADARGPSGARREGPRKRAVSRRPLLGAGLRPRAVAIGISTGGPSALDHVIPRLPGDFGLPVFLVQHMPPVFTAQLARRLDEKSRVEVVEAQQGQPVRPGTVYLAPGDYHMSVKDGGEEPAIKLDQGPPVNSCRPSVDVLFRSVAALYGARAVAVVMTGMGQDGLKGCKALKEKGAFVIAQDRETSVVWGMPRFVAEEGLADRICPLDDIVPAVLEVVGVRGVVRAEPGDFRRNKLGS